jgi:carbamoyl-phosphate synthase/aspartate carbamoyltransferase/dihydroorotase
VLEYENMGKENLIKLPGLIDAHVHLREPGATHKEDFETGTRAAVAGGYTTIIDMPNNPKPTVTPEALYEKINLAQGRIYCDLGFHFGATAESVDYYNELGNKFRGLKLYMSHTTGPLLVDKNEDLEKIFSIYPKNRPILIHGEGEAFDKAIELAKKYNHRVHICHVSQEREVSVIRKMKQDGFPITCEVTCHHLFLNDNDAKQLGPWGSMRPPLQPEKDRLALWKAINDNTIDIIASDHAPHTMEEKMSDKPPFGVPGLETTLPLLLTAVNEGKLSLERLIELTSKKPAEIYRVNIDKDTFTLVNMTEKGVINSKRLFTKCGWSPFDGMELRGKVFKTVLRNETVFEDGIVLDIPKGRVIY